MVSPGSRGDQGLAAWLLIALLALRCCCLGSCNRLEVSQDFAWMSQGLFPQVPAFFLDISRSPYGFVVWGAWGGCEGGWRTDKIRLLCFEVGQTCWACRNRMHAEVMAWEKERGRRFLYIISADESGTFTLKPTCSPAGCGDFPLLPREGESAASFWQRALAAEQPAVATAVVRPASCGMRVTTMRGCTPHLDWKTSAFHWSVQHLFWPAPEEWSRVSTWSVDSVPREIWSALFTGYTAHYFMFQMGPSSAHPEHHKRYIRNAHPWLPFPRPDGSFADSDVVAWMRPRLTRCASARIGPSWVLLRRCHMDTCRLPGKVKAGAEDEVDLSIDYSEIVKCRPWARRWQQNRTRRCRAAPRDRTPPADLQLVQTVYGRFGRGWAHVQHVEKDSANDPLSRLCATGRKTFSALAEPAAPNSWDAAVVREVEILQESVRRRAPDDVHPDCFEVCKPLILGALLVAGGGADAAAHARELDCIAAMVISWSWMDMLTVGWLGPFEMMLQLTGGRGLPDGAPSVLEPGNAPSNESGWLRRAADTPQAAWREVSVLAGDGWPCFLEKAMPHLFEALHTADWRHGSVFAAQRYVASCMPPTLFHPLASYMWAMLVLIGRAGVDATPPQPLACGPEPERAGVS